MVMVCTRTKEMAASTFSDLMRFGGKIQFIQAWWPHTFDHASFPWQGVLFKSRSCQFLNKAPCQGKTRVNLCRTHEQIKLLVKETSRLCGGFKSRKTSSAAYTRAIETCQGKLLGEKLVHRTHEQGKLPRKLSRKTWSSVRGLTLHRGQILIYSFNIYTGYSDFWL